MNIYFACSIYGGRQDSEIYEQMVAALLEDGHQVPTADNAGPKYEQLEADREPAEVYTRDSTWVRECDVLIAEVTTPSHGVGYEIAYALCHDKPVLCLASQGTVVSKMLTGNTETAFSYQTYSTVSEGVSLMRSFLSAQT